MHKSPSVQATVQVTLLGMAVWERLRTPGYRRLHKLWFAGTAGLSLRYPALLLAIWLNLCHPLLNAESDPYWQTLVRFLMVLRVLVGLPYRLLTHCLRQGAAGSHQFAGPVHPGLY